MRRESPFNESLQKRDAAQQKRKRARITVNEAGQILLGGDSGQLFPCTLTDVGTGGLSLQTNGAIYEGDRMRIRFKLGGRPLEVSGEAVRVSGKSVGIQYRDLDDEQLEAIQEFIHSSFFQQDRNRPR